MKTPLQLVTEALRSGEYKQGKHRLQTNDNLFCCLGVICKTAQKQGIRVNLNFNGILIGEDLSSQTEVLNWINLNSFQGYFSGIPEKIKNININNLTTLNDSGDCSFSEIADILEKRELDLFKQQQKEK